MVRKIVDSMNDLNQKQNCLRFVQITASVPQRHIVFNMGQGYQIIDCNNNVLKLIFPSILYVAATQ